MNFPNPFKKKSKRRSRVRQMGNFAGRIEMMIYLMMGLIILVSLIISVFGLWPYISGYAKESVSFRAKRGILSRHLSDKIPSSCLAGRRNDNGR